MASCDIWQLCSVSLKERGLTNCIAILKREGVVVHLTMQIALRHKRHVETGSIPRQQGYRRLTLRTADLP